LLSATDRRISAGWLRDSLFLCVRQLTVDSFNSTYYYLYYSVTYKTHHYSMPRISGKRRVEGGISEYLLQMADIIKVDDIQGFDPDDENTVCRGPGGST